MASIIVTAGFLQGKQPILLSMGTFPIGTVKSTKYRLDQGLWLVEVSFEAIHTLPKVCDLFGSAMNPPSPPHEACNSFRGVLPPPPPPTPYTHTNQRLQRIWVSVQLEPSPFRYQSLQLIQVNI